MENITDAIVLKEIAYKDNDSILTLFSLDRGKITASAKGVKKAGAKLKFAAQPFCFAEYVFAPTSSKRNTIISATLKDSFYELRHNMLKFYCACCAVEFSGLILPDEMPAPDIFLMLLKCLSDLSYTTCSEKGVLIKFLIDALSASGYRAEFEACGFCGCKILNGVQYFNFEQGCVTCQSCLNGRKLSTSTLNVLCDVQNGCYINRDADGEKRALRLLSNYILQKIGATVDLIETIALLD